MWLFQIGCPSAENAFSLKKSNFFYASIIKLNREYLNFINYKNDAEREVTIKKCLKHAYWFEIQIHFPSN